MEIPLKEVMSTVSSQSSRTPSSPIVISPYNKVLLVGHLWLAQTTSVTIQKLTGHSIATIAQLLGLFRQLVASSLDEQTSGRGSHD